MKQFYKITAILAALMLDCAFFGCANDTDDDDVQVAEITIAVGSTSTVGEPPDSELTIESFSSSDPTIATVEKAAGIPAVDIHGVKAETCTVTINFSSGVTRKLKVTVVQQ